MGAIAAAIPDEYTHWRNKIQFTGSTRFYLDPSDPDLESEPVAVRDDIRSTLQTWIGTDPDFYERLLQSSILMPGWSADMGSFVNDTTGTVKLKGTIVAGVMDVRGTADVHGTMLMTFHPVAGEGPLEIGGKVESFNTTIGYFGPSDGDEESIEYSNPAFRGFGQISLRYNPRATSPDGIPWPLSFKADSLSYYEGGDF